MADLGRDRRGQLNESSLHRHAAAGLESQTCQGLGDVSVYACPPGKQAGV